VKVRGVGVAPRVSAAAAAAAVRRQRVRGEKSGGGGRERGGGRKENRHLHEVLVVQRCRQHAHQHLAVRAAV
jgi:hypothetical protein